MTIARRLAATEKDPYWTNVTLLLRGEGANGGANATFLDSSSNAFTVTNSAVVGQGVLPYTTPFADPISAGYFSLQNGYLSVADNAAFNLAGSAWTIDGWLMPQADATVSGIIAKRSGSTTSWELYQYYPGAKVSFYDGTTAYVGSSGMTLNVWNHIAASHDGTNLSLYTNGTRVLGPTAVTITNQSVGLIIGRESTNDKWFTGKIANLRLVKGTALYSGSTLTVPTAPTTNVSGTSLLLNFANGPIVDSTGVNLIGGNATISTARSKFGASSISFVAASTQALAMPSGVCAFGKGDFTFECWIYLDAWPVGSGAAIIDTLSRGGVGTRGNDFVFIVTNTGKLNIFAGGSFRGASSASIPTGQWSHVAVTRSDGTWKYFINGIKDSTSFSNGIDIASGNAAALGRINDDAGYWLDGNLDDVRITKGVARYTADFTPPSRPFPNG